MQSESYFAFLLTLFIYFLFASTGTSAPNVMITVYEDYFYIVLFYSCIRQNVAYIYWLHGLPSFVPYVSKTSSPF